MNVSGTLQTYLRALLFISGTVLLFTGCTLSANVTSLIAPTETPSPANNFWGQLSKTNAINWSYEFDATETLERAVLSAAGDTIVASVVNDLPAVMRIRPDGSVNTAFGNNGIALLPTVPDYSGFNAIYVSEDSDQNILVGWSISSEWNGSGFDYAIALTRFNAIGVQDLTFGDSGLFVFEISAPIYVRGILPDATGYYIFGPGNFSGDGYVGYIFRINKDGTFDSSYGNSGQLIFTPPVVAGENFQDMHFASAVIAPDSALYIVGQIHGDLSGYSAVIYKVLPNGTIDNTWGSSGLIRYDNPGPALDKFHDIKIHDNKLYIAGQGPNFPDLDGVILRYNLNGTLDNTFNGDGVRRFQDVAGFATGADYVRILAIDSSGNTYIHGTSSDAADSNLTFIAKLLPDGSLDASYGNAGLTFIDFDREEDYPRSALLNGDNSITAFNNSTIRDGSNSMKGNLVSARVLPNGVIDSTYGDSGFRTISEKFLQRVDLETVGSQFHDGAYFSFYSVTAGNDGPVLAIHKTLPNGDTDTNFGNAGFFVVRRVLNSKVIIGDNIYVMAAYFDAGSTDLSLKIFKYSLDGTPDANFGIGGSMELPWDEDFETTATYYQMGMGSDQYLYVTAYLSDLVNGLPHTTLWKVHAQTGEAWTDPLTSNAIKILGPADNGRHREPLLLVDNTHNKIYLLSGDTPNSDSMIVRRLNFDLSLDNDFSSDGVLPEVEVVGQFTEVVEFNKMYLFNGDLYLSVYEQNDDFGVNGLVKISSTGAIDTNFGDNGLLHPGGSLSDRIWHDAEYFYDDIRKNILVVNYAEPEDEDFFMSFSQINPNTEPALTAIDSQGIAPLYYDTCAFSGTHGLHCIRNTRSSSKTETSLSVFK